MKKLKLDDFQSGWLCGNFSPALISVEQIEIGVKRYKSGHIENTHIHKIATEWTLIVDGAAEVNGEIFLEGDIIEIAPNEPAKFRAIQETTTVVIKSPSIPNDKYLTESDQVCE